MTLNHSRLCELPTELQLHIWSYVQGPRAIAIEAVAPGQQGVKLIQDCPIALHVCQHSRSLFVRKYGSVFAPRKPVWKWQGADLRSFLRKVILAMGFDIQLPVSRIDTVKRMKEYFNKPDLDTIGMAATTKLAFYGTNGVSCVWFDFSQDVAFFKYQESSLEFWGPWTQREELHDVLMGVYGVWGGGPWSVRYLQWKEDNENEAGIETISVLNKEWNEVYVLRQAKEPTSLKPGQWSYWLDTLSRLFQHEMGASWSKVTWRVEIAKKDEQLWESVWNIWEKDHGSWKANQILVCADDSAVKPTWLIAGPRVQFQQRLLLGVLSPKLKVLREENGSKIYLGLEA